ncbi:MAG: penicillin-binding protein 2 [Bacteroidales bacterium]|nr:penicillin-binding protein 2 [Bacteroidales bacterium]
MEVNRNRILVIGLWVVITILLGRIFYIQIIDSSYKRDAQNNSMVYTTIYPPRGIIYDRNGEVLVGNRVCYDIMVTPREIRAFDTLALASVLEIDTTWLRSQLDYYRKYRSRIGFRTLQFAKQVSVERYMKFAERAYDFPGFSAQVRTVRDYPFNAGGNLLGYVSEVNDRDIEREPEAYRSGDFIGKTGLEAAREKDLRGEKGYHVYLRDSRNKVQNSYKEGEYDKEAVPGKDIVTTIDAHLQQYGQELMHGKKGSLIAIEPSTGEILAMVSSPCIDVDVLSDIGSHYAAIAADPGKPMFNRTVMASYPPGSVFKLVNGLIGLQEGVLEPWYQYPCSHGYAYTKSRKLGCHGHRSPLRLDEAVMMSCNAYFCYVLKNLLENTRYDSVDDAFDKWREYVLSFGFGQKLGSDFPSELGGNIPTSKLYDKRYGRRRWKTSNVISLSIGQGEIGATPLQIANLAAIMANRGYYYIPHIVKDSDSLSIDPKYKEKHYTMVDTSHFSKVIGGMWMAVNGGPGAGGTAGMACVPGLDICGKTGTAQNPHGADNSVFICFAPRENPKIAVVGYIENAGWGGSWACPLASLLIEKYLLGQTTRPELEERMMKTTFNVRGN